MPIQEAGQAYLPSRSLGRLAEWVRGPAIGPLVGPRGPVARSVGDPGSPGEMPLPSAGLHSPVLESASSNERHCPPSDSGALQSGVRSTCCGPKCAAGEPGCHSSALDSRAPDCHTNSDCRGSANCSSQTADRGIAGRSQTTDRSRGRSNRGRSNLQSSSSPSSAGRTASSASRRTAGSNWVDSANPGWSIVG